MQIVGVNGVFRNTPADIIGCPIYLPSPDAAASHEHGETEGVMIASRGIFVVATVFPKGRPTEFRAPLNQSAVEQPALFQIADQRGDWLIYYMRIVFQLLVKLAVVIPRGVDNVDEANAALHHATCEKAIAGKILLSVAGFATATAAWIFSVDTVVFKRGDVFSGQIN